MYMYSCTSLTTLFPHVHTIFPDQPHAHPLLITEFIKEDSPFCLTRAITRTMIGPCYTPPSFGSEGCSPKITTLPSNHYRAYSLIPTPLQYLCLGPYDGPSRRALFNKRGTPVHTPSPGLRTTERPVVPRTGFEPHVQLLGPKSQPLAGYGPPNLSQVGSLRKGGFIGGFIKALGKALLQGPRGGGVLMRGFWSVPQATSRPAQRWLLPPTDRPFCTPANGAFGQG